MRLMSRFAGSDTTEEPGRFDMSDLLFFVAISLVLFGVLFGIAAVTAAERRTHDGTNSVRGSA
jgi:hypothetical protein